VRTRGAAGGEWTATGGGDIGPRSGSWHATPLPGEPVDAYGCGDSFAAGLTYGLGAGMALEDAIELGARCGAACLCGRGPYAGQLELA
jgi:ribokinase